MSKLKLFNVLAVAAVVLAACTTTTPTAAPTAAAMPAVCQGWSPA